MLYIIIYLIWTSNGWRFEAIDPEPNSYQYCEVLKEEVEGRFNHKLGNMKIICVEDRSSEI